MPESEKPFPESLCHRCRHCRIVSGKNSRFLMCEALPQKYLPQPVRACPVFAPRDEAPPR